MVSPYPGAFDSLVNPDAGDQLDDPANPHAATHGAANNAMEKTQRVIGTSPEGGYATVRARLDGVEGTIDSVAPAVAAAFDVVDAKGDLIAGTGPGAVARLAVGTDGQAVVADSAATAGLVFEGIVAVEGSGLPPGGAEGEVLVKLSDADYDIGWGVLPGAPAGAVDIVVPTPYPTGGTVTTYSSGGKSYRVHAFDTIGVDEYFVVDAASGGFISDLLAIGGGGGGGDGDASNEGGGGGAGGVWNGLYAFGVGSHRVYVGAGGARNLAGETTKFDDVWCYGGGYGGQASNASGGNGGHGGGGAGVDGAGGTATRGSLDAGATTSTTILGSNGNAAVGAEAGAGGGLSLSSSISGSTVVYAKPGAGGAGGADGTAGDTPGTGGGGGDNPSHVGGAGRKGVVIVRYRTA